MTPNQPQRGLFVTGTDTGVGKTYVAAMIASALRQQGRQVAVYKPAASGCQRVGQRLVSEDVEVLWSAAGKPGERERVCPQCFEAALAPHLAARAEGKRIDAQRLRSGIQYWSPRCEIVIVEGAGGLLSPMSDEDYVADLALAFGYPLIVVSPNVLGTINQTLQTLLTAQHYGSGLPVAGIVLNDIRPPGSQTSDASVETNQEEIERRSRVPLLAHTCWQMAAFAPPIDWWKLSARP